MVYTEETKKQMDGILAAFADKLRGLDIRYAEEKGYFRIIAGREEAMDTPDQLVETLIGSIADAVMAQKLPSHLPEDGDVNLETKTEIYHQIMEPVKRLEENRERYVHLAINYYQDRFERKKDDKGYGDT